MQIRLLSLLIIAILHSTSLPYSDKDHHGTYFKVKRVVDGDTFWIDDGSAKGLKIRLIGVDAPETRNTGRKEAGRFGKESSDYLSSLIAGKKIRLEYDVDHFDRYGRTLAYAYLEDGTFVNSKLVKEGYATVMTVPPNVKYAYTFLKLERKARKQKRGMWDTDF